MKVSRKQEPRYIFFGRSSEEDLLGYSVADPFNILYPIMDVLGHPLSFSERPCLSKEAL
jgi:hypothetical protein